MGAPKKNSFWKLRSKHGVDKKYTPELLLATVNEFAKVIEKNPLYETIVQGGKVFEVPKMRAMTIERFCLFAEIDPTTFQNYEKDKDLRSIITYAKSLFRSQKFEGAAAGFLNANIIARDLGLKDKSDITTNDNDIKGVNIIVQSAETKGDIDKLIKDND